MYNIINYQINQQQITNIFKMQNENVKKTIPQFISNKIILYVYIFTNTITNEIQKINNYLKNLYEIYNGNITLECNQVKSFFYQRFLNITNAQKNTYNLFQLIHNDIHKKLYNYINQLLEKENKIEVKAQLIKFLNELDIIYKERHQLIQEYLNSIKLYQFLNQHFN